MEQNIDIQYPVWERHGQKITINQGGLFEIIYDGELIKEKYATFADAEVAVENITKNRQASQKELSLPVISGDGVKRVITGLDAETGQVTTIPKMETDGSWKDKQLFVDHPKVEQLLQETQAAVKTAQHLCKMLGQYKLQDWDGYGSYSYAESVSNLERNYAEIVKGLKDAE